MVERGIDNINDIIPFINKIFNKNFRKLLPKIYTTNQYKSHHYTVKEKDKLLGVTASIPVTLGVYDRSLDARGIGMVSTSKKARGRGIMSAMLKRAISDAEKENVDFMFLSGNRQRYEYFGFVPAGYKYTFTLLKHNIRHMKRKLDFSFIRIDEKSEELDKVIACYNVSGVKYLRDDFFKTVSSWTTKEIYAILNASGEVIGHIAKKWFKVVEFNTIETENSAYILKAFAECLHLPVLKVEVYPSSPDIVKNLSSYFEYPEISSACNINVLNYKNTIETLLYMQSKNAPLSDFNVNVLIGDELLNIFSTNNEPHAISLGNVSIPSENSKISSPCDVDVIKEGTAKSYHVDYAFSKDEATSVLFSAPMATHNGLPFSLPLFVTFLDNV